MNFATLNALNQRALAEPKRPDRDLMEAINAFPYRGFIEVQISGAEPFVMFSNYDDIVAQHYLFLGPDSFESFSLKVWARVASVSKLALDVGAFTGIFSLTAVRASPTIRVVGFEPSTNTFSRYVTNVLANGMGGRIGTVKAALGPAHGQSTLKHPAGVHCLGSEETLVEGHHRDVWFEEPVRVLPADGLVAAYQQNPRDFVIEADFSLVDLVKIDVEGFEMNVLKGMKGLIEKNHPVFLIECLSLAQFDEVFGALRPFGYDFRFVDDHKGFHLSRDRFAAHPRNVLFALPDAASDLQASFDFEALT